MVQPLLLQVEKKYFCLFTFPCCLQHSKLKKEIRDDEWCVYVFVSHPHFPTIKKYFLTKKCGIKSKASKDRTNVRSLFCMRALLCNFGTRMWGRSHSSFSVRASANMLGTSGGGWLGVRSSGSSSLFLEKVRSCAGPLGLLWWLPSVGRLGLLLGDSWSLPILLLHMPLPACSSPVLQLHWFICSPVQSSPRPALSHGWAAGQPAEEESSRLYMVIFSSRHRARWCHEGKWLPICTFGRAC